MVLLRPHHPRICAGYLERAGARGSATAVAGTRRAARSDPLESIEALPPPSLSLRELQPQCAEQERHCERSEAIQKWLDRLDCFVGYAPLRKRSAFVAGNDERHSIIISRTLMHARPPHLFDEATRVTAGDSCWQGRTSDDYWAFVGPFGGATAATILRALIDHPQRSGDPLTLTVNFCAPIAQGGFDLDIRLVKANRSTQHWCVELAQDGAEVATLATAVFAERRPSWSHQQAEFPQARPFEQILSYPKTAATWVKQYDFRFVEGNPDFGDTPQTGPASAFSKLWIADRKPRKI